MSRQLPVACRAGALAHKAGKEAGPYTMSDLADRWRQPCVM